MTISNPAALEAFTSIKFKKERPWKGEEEVRMAWGSALEKATGFHFDFERNRNDCSYNNIIIEFKAPGLFAGSKTSVKFLEATDDRLLKYIRAKATTQKADPQDYIGIAIDGDHICFCRVVDDEIVSDELIPFSEYGVQLVVQAVQSDTRRNISSDNLLKDFGHSSPVAKDLMQSLADGLSAQLINSDNSKIKMLFEEWRTLYGQVAEMSVLQADQIQNEMYFDWNGSSETNISGRLFVIHTYNSLMIKLLAAEIVSGHGLTSHTQPAQTMAALLDDEMLINRLKSDIEGAALFEQAGIKGFVEEAIFSWYLDLCYSDDQHNIIPAIRQLLGMLSLYRTDRLEHTRDVLRDLYQELVPGRLRQSLGEFYTPDWLVDYTVDRIPSPKWLVERFLDPTCGSGSFVIAVIRKIRNAAEKGGWANEKISDHLCDVVWGFDLNPLAVQTARLNFLMEIADLLSPGQEVELPIMLADAIYSPADDPDGTSDVVSYYIGSKIAGLHIKLPATIAFDRERLDDVFDYCGRAIERDVEYEDVSEELVKQGYFSLEEADAWKEPFKHTYQQILDLHRNNWNGIWFRVIRNFFWSATAGKFDHIVGNPPWVRWSKLPEAYRERVKPTCEEYNIFSDNRRHGGNELDISAMIVYTTADKWLKSDGTISFVITGTLFKNPSSAGFRKFKLDASTYLTPVSVDDMEKLKPFADAANHTVVASFQKSSRTPTYPVPYSLWDTVDGVSRNIPEDWTYEKVDASMVKTAMEAAPVGVEGSPWSVLRQGRYDLLKTLSGECQWTKGRKGITVDLNGVYFVEVHEEGGGRVKIETRPEAGKKELPRKSAWIEPDALYPLLKGAGDFEPCYVRPKKTLFTFVPNTGISQADYDAADALMSGRDRKHTRKYLEQFEGLLEQRSTYRRQMAGAPYFAIYNVGDYTFQPWKVVWPEMSSSFKAAVVHTAKVPGIGERVYVPDHKVYYAAFDDKETAFYLCGLLNNSLVREWIDSHTIKIQKGNVFQHLNLPEFAPKDAHHQQLSELVEQAHQEDDKAVRRKLLEEIDALGEKLIAPASNRRIRKSKY